MTEKRFYIQCDECNAWSVWEKDKDVVVFDLLKYDAEVVCKALNELSDENEQFKKALRVAYLTNLTEPTKNTIEQIAKHCGVDLE